METEYNIWLVIEKVDEEKDFYETVEETKLAEFSGKKGLKNAMNCYEDIITSHLFVRIKE